MQAGQPGQTKSIFDTIEEQSKEPWPFVWQTELQLCEYSSEDLLLEGELQCFNELKKSLSKRRYILTKISLIRYKVRIGLISQ